MQAAGRRASKRLSAGPHGGGLDKQQREQEQKAQQVNPRKHKRSCSDAADAPAAKKRRSAPELPKAGGQGHATPVAPSRSAYNLRTRSSLPAAGTRLTDGPLPASLPSSVRPRNPNQKATWNELPDEVLKIICQNLDPATTLLARGVSVSMREACNGAPIQLRFTLPMQSSPWSLFQLEAWERRVNGVAGLLNSGRMRSQEVQLRMEGGEAWKGDENIPAAQINNAVLHLMPLLGSLRRLGSVAENPITHLDAELPINAETLVGLDTALPGVTSLRLDSLIPPPGNHVMPLAECRVFTSLRKLDLGLTAWDQMQYLSQLTQLTELHIRYYMWNIPELTPLVSLQQLHTFGIEVLDDRARFQLDFLGPLVRGVSRLRNLRASVILSRTVVSEGGPASCDFLSACNLKDIRLDVRVPQDAARQTHVHFRNLHLAPPGCKVHLTIRADALTRETSFDSAATPNGVIMAPRLGMAIPGPTDARERWGALHFSTVNTAFDPRPNATLDLHLRGYRGPLTMLPDLSAAHLVRLQISNSRLSPTDFTTLSACTSLEHLFIRFAYVPESSSPGSASTGHALSAAADLASYVQDTLGPREMQASLNARLAASGCHGMLTRARKSLLADRRNGATGRPSLSAEPADCTDTPASYVLMPLLKLRKLRSLELLEEREEGTTTGTAAAPAGAAAAAGGAGSGARQPGGTSGAGAGSSTAGGAGVGSSRAAGPPPSEAAAAGCSKTRLSTQHPGGAASAAGTSRAAAAAAAAGPEPLPISRSGLTHFLRALGLLVDLDVLSLQLLAEEESLPDCPCKTSCFAVGTKGREPPARLDAEAIQRLLALVSSYRVVLGGMQQPVDCNWYRPSAWPPLTDA